MLKFIKKNTPIFLFLFFVFFYSIQVPEYTHKPDVITFALRSNLDKPILEYAFLDSSTKLEGKTLPNYHIGHTVLLWTLFKIVPFNFSSPIVLSGIISSIFGALSIVLTFLIALKVKVNRKASLYISVFFGFLPIFWEHSIIGEIHTQQMFFTLLFVYCFLNEKFILSSFFFLIANLITPLSGLAFGLIFLNGFDKRKIIIAFFVGAGALITYFIIFYFLGIDLSEIFGVDSTMPDNRGLLYRIFALATFVLININFYTFFLFKGIKTKTLLHRNLFINLSIAIIPQILLALYSTNFLIEFGSFQIVLFWALAFPIGIYISTLKIISPTLIIAFILNAIVTYSIFIYPHYHYGKEIQKAGDWLRENNYTDIKMIGNWDNVGIIYYRNGSQFKNLNHFYLDNSSPADIDLIRTNKNKLLITEVKQQSIKKVLSDYKIQGFNHTNRNLDKKIKCGTIKKVYNNNFVSIYEWEK